MQAWMPKALQYHDTARTFNSILGDQAQMDTPTNMQTGTDKLLARKERAFGWIVFNNPSKRNAISADMQQAMTAVLDDYARDPAIRVVILRGDGDKAFISGGDISQFAEKRGTLEGVHAEDAIGIRTDHALQNFPKPTIAMIRGFCMGGGMRVAANCDLRFASDDARFSIPAAKLGVGYRYAGVQRLVEIVGAANAADIFYSGRQFDASEAWHMGFINRVLPAAELEQFIVDYATNIARNAPLTIAAAKRCLIEIGKETAQRDLARCEQVVDDCFTSKDYIEGRTAFTEKRKPKFEGR